MKKSTSAYSKAWHDARLSAKYIIATKVRGAVTARVKNALVSACETFQDDYITKTNIPYYTGNLFDSTGVAAYQSGRLITFRPPVRTARSRTYKYKGHIYTGASEAQKARTDGQRQFPTGLAAQLYSAVPYSKDVNEGKFPFLKPSSPGYFDRAARAFEDYLYTKLEKV